MRHEIVACLAHDDDLRTPAAHASLRRVLNRPVDGRVISIGGGPRRVHEALTNLNIIVSAGVDIAATAYRLPFRDTSIPAIHCEAVLEHLEFPEDAVREMFRVLRPGGLVFASTPFLQPYHGYPDHFQNFTLRGHTRLFERAGFAIVDAGTCVGPTFAVADVLANYAREALPGRIFSRACERLIRFSGRLFRLADLAVRDRTSSSNVCSSSFLLAEKPPASPSVE